MIAYLNADGWYDIFDDGTFLCCVAELAELAEYGAVLKGGN